MATTKRVDLEIAATDNASKAVRGVADAVQGIAPAARSAQAASDASLGAVQDRGAQAASSVKGISEQLAFVQRAFVALAGGSFLASQIKDALATADAYNNLQARIKLATGEGEAFRTALEGVQRIALGTNSSLEGTATLFARLTDAGKNAGQSAQDAQRNALSLTETINQAIQLSGGSAESSNAALTQFIQGLQSGVLRGEEFNSVMEQQPRLARAIADGLGVTTGELRKLANEGRLTADVLTGSIKSQSETLKTEFNTLPATVGRSIQNLSTAWTVYIGNADKATGASSLAAQAVDVLAKNLDTVAGALVDAGQVAAGFAAVRLAQTFLGIGAAATTAAAATAAATAAAAANTVAQAQNAAALRASDLAFKQIAADVAAQTALLGVNTAATSSNAAARAASASGAATAAASIGKFGAILSTLKTFSLIGIVTNFKDIGTFIGEGIAKLQGFKDSTDILAQAEKERVIVMTAQRDALNAQAAANKAALDRQFELSAAAKTTLATFDDLVKKGDSAGEALGKIGKDFDLASQPGIANAAAVLDKLAADGRISAGQFKQAWADALKTQDLGAFEVSARAAFAGSAREGERLAAVLDASLREAIRRSGADFSAISGGMGAAARSAINDTQLIIDNLGALQKQGVDTAAALTASLGQGIKTADSVAALNAVRGEVEQVRKVLGDRVANSLLEQLNEQAARVTQQLTGVADAFKRLGISSDADLKRAADASRRLFEEIQAGGGSVREQAAAFQRMAADAIASGDAASLAFVRSRAAAQGFTVSTDEAGRVTVKSMKDAAAATDAVGESADRASGGYRRIAQDADAAAAAAKRLAEANDRFSAPNGNGAVTGNTREQRLQGQNAVDDSLRLSLVNKLNTGALTKADAGGVQAFAQALAQNIALAQSANPGAISTDFLQSIREMQAQLIRMQQVLGAGAAAGTGPAARQVLVNINTPQGRQQVSTDEAGAQALVRSLQAASLAAGR